MSEGTPDNRWQVRLGTERVPLEDVEAVRDLVRSGKLRPESYVFDPQKRQWLYARDVGELRDTFAAPLLQANPEAWIVQLERINKVFADLPAVRQAIRDGRVSSGTLLRHPVLGKWMKASDALELSDEFSRVVVRIPQSAQPAPEQGSRRDGVLLFAIGAIVLVLAAIGIYSGTRRTEEPAPVSTVSTAPAAVTPPPAATPKKERPIRWIFGEPKDDKKAPTATDTTSTTVTETVAAETAQQAVAPSPEPKKTRVVEQPPIDDAEEEFIDEGGDVEFQSTPSVRGQVSGDTQVLIDRSKLNPHYHVAGCPKVKPSMVTVSLDLARQGYGACPVCKPPQ
jgi:hypothetical protein